MPKILKLILPLAAAVLFGQSLRGQGHYQIAADAKTFLGPRDQAAGHVFRAAVCPDGSVYLSDGLGRLIRIDDAGQTVNDQRGLEAAISALAVACDDKGRAIAGSSPSSSIAVLEPGPGKNFTLISKIRAKPLITPFEILPLPGQSGYIVLGMSAADKSPLHTVAASGEVQAAFGGFMNHSRAGAEGTLFWDESHEIVNYLPENPYSLQEFTPAGQLLAEHNRPASDFPYNRIVRAAAIGNSELLVQVSGSYFEVVNNRLEPQSALIDTADLGHLWGSDAKGNVYFTSISAADGMNIIKAHVVKGN